MKLSKEYTSKYAEEIIDLYKKRGYRNWNLDMVRFTLSQLISEVRADDKACSDMKRLSRVNTALYTKDPLDMFLAHPSVENRLRAINYIKEIE